MAKLHTLQQLPFHMDNHRVVHGVVQRMVDGHVAVDGASSAAVRMP